jgi:predicted metal-dependent phosphotriesterase family hydrolase
VRAADHVLPTVTGSTLRPGADLRLDAHGHAWIAPPPLAPVTMPALHDESRLVAGLERFAGAAAPRRAALLDCQAPGCGRDAAALARIAAKSGVAIAALTGFHFERWYPMGLRPWTTSDSALNSFTRELEGGFREAPMARAAAVKAAFTGTPEADDPCWEAAIEACKQTGALIVVDTGDGTGVEDLLAFVRDRGLASDRVYLLHVDVRGDQGLLAELASDGALLGFSSSLREGAAGDAAPYALLQGLLELGVTRCLAIGLALSTPALWEARSNDDADAGPAALVGVVESRLRALGVDEDAIDALLGGSLLERAARPEVPLGRKGR